VRIAIFGGSFDPIHIAHVAIVENALIKLDIDRLIVVPTYLNPFKNSFYLDPETRFKLLKKVFQKFENVEVSDYEIKQQKTSYSIDTVIYLKNLYNPSKIYFIIGEDNVLNLEKWHKISELRELVEFIVASRNGFDNKKANKFRNLDIDIDISSTSLRSEMRLDYIPVEIRDDILNLKKKVKFLSTRLENIRKILDDKKAENIEIIDLRSKDYIVDYVVIATTLNPKHGFSLLNYLKTDLKPNGEEFLRVDEDDEWTIIDLGDMFIHLMSEKYRTKYSLEDFLSKIGTKEEE